MVSEAAQTNTIAGERSSARPEIFPYRPILFLILLWASGLFLLGLLSVFNTGFGLKVWPIGEDRNWIYFIQNREAIPLERAFWAADARNPLAPWWYALATPLIEASPYGIYAVRKFADLFCAISAFLLVSRLFFGRADRLALTVAALAMFWNFNGYESQVLWTMLAALGCSALAIWSYLIYYDSHGRRGGFFVFSVLTYLVGIATYTLQASTLLAIFGLALVRPYGEPSEYRWRPRLRRAVAHTLPYAAALAIFSLIWMTAGYPKEFVAVSDTPFINLLRSIRYLLWHSTYSTQAIQILNLGGAQPAAFAWIAGIAGAATAAFLFLSVRGRGARQESGGDWSGFVSTGVAIAGICAGTIALEATSTIWFPGTRSMMLQQIAHPVIYTLAVLALARAAAKVTRHWRALELAGNAALVFFTIACAMHYNGKLVRYTAGEQQFERALKAIVPSSATPVLFLVRKDHWQDQIVRAVSHVYARTFYGSPLYGLRFLQPGGPIQRYEDSRDVIFGPAGVFISAAPGDPKWEPTPPPRWIPYNYVHLIDYDGKQARPVRKIDANELKGFRAVMQLPDGKLDLSARFPERFAASAAGRASPSGGLGAMALRDSPALNHPVRGKTDFGLITTDLRELPALLGVAGGVGVAGDDFIFAHANSVIEYKLKANHWKTFSFAMGLDDIGSHDEGGAVYVVKGDGKELFRSGVVRSMTAPQAASVSIAGVRKLELIVEGGASIVSDEAYWIKPSLH
jgi:hypothetical protein